MDQARQHLNADIQRAERTRSMLKHLADAVLHGPDQQRGGETYQDDAIDALEHGALLAKRERENLEHVAVLYDAKVNTPVPDPIVEQDARAVAEDACGDD